ncbi:SUMF1/EgtB/PvdO family nonheme iron enzyme [Microbacterium sp.]|uniref:SUMF1/EgtB/PvdO family nonheme iron enzyme n=1 Tax=Microbacterium sp. TaxID=51671 RepID=UPI002810D9BE|nr:SUMF1/EgtB/PvdO family nonheme iron enzyme [Microbacterium sp.]
MSGGFDPLVPREIDLPTSVPLAEDVAEGEVALALDDAKIFAAPADPADLPAWRAQLTAWREGARARHGETARYDDPASAWASRCFTVAQVWLWDELFFDFAAQRFTPERLLDDARERFGGLDGVVLWHAYPVIGIDDRNQWDFYEVPGLEAAARALREAGVAVFVDYNPWDTGTRRGGEDATELARVIRRLGADGVFLDTLRKADPDLVAALDDARPGIGLEGESKLATERIADHTLSWAQWFADSPVPGVLRARWFERRHMQHHIRRWHRDHSGELISAWLNGVGVMVWEVVFGVWVGWNPRDAATLRRMLPVQRGLHRWLVEGEWTPLSVSDGAVHGSAFALDGVTLLTLANTGSRDAVHRPEGTGRWIALHEPGAPVVSEAPAVTVPAHGIAALLHLGEGADEPAELAELRTRLAERTHVADAAFPHRRAERLSAPAWEGPRAPDPAELARETVELAPGRRILTVRFRQRETGMYDGAPYVDEWKPLPPRLHDQRTLERVADIRSAVRVAAVEVTEAQYALFLQAIGEPTDEAASADRPATGVTFTRARQYAAWAGGRLPSEDEWQLAASEPGFRRLEPLVWNWTESEHSDGRTRFVMLKGGSAHESAGSDWYFDGGPRSPQFAAKLLLPGLGVDASPSIGFRVCWDVSA